MFAEHVLRRPRFALFPLKPARELRDLACSGLRPAILAGSFARIDLRRCLQTADCQEGTSPALLRQGYTAVTAFTVMVCACGRRRDRSTPHHVISIPVAFCARRAPKDPFGRKLQHGGELTRMKR
jgi:hypothetical protein